MIHSLFVNLFVESGPKENTQEINLESLDVIGVSFVFLLFYIRKFKLTPVRSNIQIQMKNL